MALDHFKKKKNESKVRIKGPHFKQRGEIKSHYNKPSNPEQEMNFKKNGEENIATAKIKEKQLKEKTSIGEEKVQTESIEKLKNSTDSIINHNNQQQYDNEFKKNNFQMNSIKKNCSNLKSSLKEVAIQTQKIADDLDNLMENNEELKSDINISDLKSQVKDSNKESELEEKKDNLDSNLNQNLLDEISLDKVSIIIILHILLQRFFTDNQDDKK